MEALNELGDFVIIVTVTPASSSGHKRDDHPAATVPAFMPAGREFTPHDQKLVHELLLDNDQVCVLKR